MSDIATCAVCGEKKELCRSVRIDGVSQPRFCKKCLLSGMSIELKIRDDYWILQMAQLNDQESLDALNRQNKGESYKC